MRSRVMSNAFNGPLQVSANGRYFVDQSGAPFFWLGDTAWPLLVRYTPPQAESYLENRAAKGFTVIQCVIAWTEADGPQPHPNLAGQRPWLEDDPATPNAAFFQPIDHLVSYAAK